MRSAQVVGFTLLSLLAFAGNSLLCRAALAHTHIDANTFTLIRLASGALVLAALGYLQRQQLPRGGHWGSALALFAYALCFSIAYQQLPTGVGALILFGAVQTSMIGYGLWQGERFRPLQLVGLLLAAGGLVGLLLPGLSAPPLLGALLMLVAGVAWGVYSLRGKGAQDPLQVTAGNFIKAVPMALVAWVLALTWAWGQSDAMPTAVSLDLAGAGYAILSGALASGLGYAVWYRVLPALRATTAATAQLAVPVIAAIGGVLWLGEALSLRLVLASLAVLGGIAAVVWNGREKPSAERARPTS